MRHSLTLTITVLALVMAGCAREDDDSREPAEPAEPAEPETVAEANPFFKESGLSYGMPPFDRIEDEHYTPAIERGMEQNRAEINAIADNPAEPTFENTIIAMERSGQLLSRVLRVFYNLSGANTNDKLQEIQREVSPKLAAHNDETMLNPDLFARVETLYEQRDDLELDPESHRLLERYYTDFVRAGAQLDPEDQERLREINSRLAELGTEFNQKVLAEVNDSAVVVDTREELEGLSDSRIEAAAKEAGERDLEGKFVITLQNTSGQPPLANLANRALRERIHKASLNRGARGNEYDTRGTIVEIVQLRAERARMLGYDTHADYVMAEQTAPSVDAVNEMLAELGPIAYANAREEAADLQAVINETEAEPFELASWDWAYYTEKLRQERYDIDDSEVRPYFELQNVLENGVFFAANGLFGITFERRDDLPTYHPDVQVWEVFEADGTPLGLMFGDFYARSNKRGGAWMNSYVVQSELLGGSPVVGNHLNITKPPEGEPTLMTWDEVTTLFHEFGHVLHGLFSDVKYPRFAATSVPRDFVEYPSQVNEMWADWPEVLENYAVHYETGEPIPQELLARVMEAEKFNEGFRSSEYLAASITDQAMHQLPPDEIPTADGLMAFETQALMEWDVHYEPVPPRYRYPYFNHMFSHAYSAAYYSYIWSEILDADSQQWFRENGGLAREAGQQFRDTILSSGGSVDAMELYRQFAGRDADMEHMLRARGLYIED